MIVKIPFLCNASLMGMLAFQNESIFPEKKSSQNKWVSLVVDYFPNSGVNSDFHRLIKNNYHYENQQHVCQL